MAEKNTKYRIMVSTMRQETVFLAASSAEDAHKQLAQSLEKQVSDDRATLEHFVICSVEEHED